MSNARYFKNNVAGLNAIALLVYDGTDTECNWDTCPKPMGLGHIGTGVRPLCARAIGMGHIGTGVGTPCPRPIGMGRGRPSLFQTVERTRQSLESPPVTLTWKESKYKMNKFHKGISSRYVQRHVQITQKVSTKDTQCTSKGHQRHVQRAPKARPNDTQGTSKGHQRYVPTEDSQGKISHTIRRADTRSHKVICNPR